jgi:hypothetical protein
MTTKAEYEAKLRNVFCRALAKAAADVVTNRLDREDAVEIIVSEVKDEMNYQFNPFLFDRVESSVRFSACDNLRQVIDVLERCAL